MSDITIAKSLIEERCAYYKYVCIVSPVGETTVVCPGYIGLYEKSPPVTHRFDYIKDALLWMVSVMQKTNRNCRRHRIPEVWPYSDIAHTYRVAMDCK